MGKLLLLPRESNRRAGRPFGAGPSPPDNLPHGLVALIPIAIALIVTKDVLLGRASLVVSGITDEPAHVVTALLVVGALYVLLGRPITRGVVVGAICGGTLIDLDHIPLALGRDWLTSETDRPITHSLLVLIPLLLVAVVLRGSRREVGLVTALALVSHFIEDMGDGNVPLLWPVMHHGVSLPYAAYLGMLLVCTGVIVLRAVRGGPSFWDSGLFRPML